MKIVMNNSLKGRNYNVLDLLPVNLSPFKVFPILGFFSILVYFIFPHRMGIFAYQWMKFKWKM